MTQDTQDTEDTQEYVIIRRVYDRWFTLAEAEERVAWLKANGFNRARFLAFTDQPGFAVVWF